MTTSERRPFFDRSGTEVLWTAAAALLVATLGYALLPGLIRMAGKSGRLESVEWALYMLMGFAFPILAMAASWWATRARATHLRIVGAIAGALVVALVGWFFWILGPAALVIAAILGLIVVAVFLMTSTAEHRLDKRWQAAMLFAASASWGAAFRHASWTDAGSWVTQSVATPVLIVAAAALSAVVLAYRSEGPASGWFRFSWRDAPAVMVFAYLSFRTTPIAEFYHWSFWVGPMESLRQGGWLLWDVPSQYGFLSILIPSLIPTGDAWQGLYVAQGALYLLTAVAIYAAISALRPGTAARVLALAFTATALFFRPRSVEMILTAQFTPAGGPMRFFWGYAVLCVLVWKYIAGEKLSDRKFALTGTAVWVASAAWSVESAIYATLAWGPAYIIFLAQRFFAEEPGQRAGRVRSILAGLALPFGALAAAAALVSLVYLVFDGRAPDWQSYYEYAILFSAGYNSLPIETAGSVWSLVTLYVVVSAIVAGLLLREPRGARLLVAVGAWGTVWGISSYFVPRSHPVNLLSLVPLLVFALVIALRLLERDADARWSSVLRVASVPLLAMPIVLTLAHGGFLELFFHRQSPLKSLTVQVPQMDPSLAQLVASAGMKPQDPVFFVSDGRYVMPRWPEVDSGRARINSLTWAPKPYEMINTLTAERRDQYITRFQERVEPTGWLVQKKEFIDSAYYSVLKLIERRSEPVERFENQEWIVIRYKARQPR